MNTLSVEGGGGGDDPECVYVDLGVVFGVGGPARRRESGGARSGEDDDHSFEEYLDELDGISWV